MTEQPPNIDGIAPLQPESEEKTPEVAVPREVASRMKGVLVVTFFLPYVLFLAWAGFLVATIPNPQGTMEQLKYPGIVSCAIGGILLLVVGLLAIKRVLAKKVTNVVRFMSMMRIALVVSPGIAVAALAPPMILREPPLSIQITNPSSQAEMIAPLPVTFSLDLAVEILGRRGLRPVKYLWDFDGDKEINDETATPTATAVYDKPGSYDLRVLLELNDGSVRRVARRVQIPDAVFSYSPARPGVDEVIRFSLEHLISSPRDIVNVRWDFNGDTIPDIESDLPTAAYSFLRTGVFPVSASVEFANKTQKIFTRDVEIFEPEPPPFPVQIISEPEVLMSPAPFGTIFSVDSEVPIESVIWDFGDGTKSRGDRVGHNFEERGVYQVTARIQAENGEVAELVEVVRVVDTLKLKDLRIVGTPQPDKRGNIRGEVPVTLDIRATTDLPLVEFTWEAPGATSIGSTEGELQAIYRRPGEYKVTVIAQDPDGKVMRESIDVVVDPPSSNVAIRMTPEGGVAPLLVRFDASETVIPDEEITGFEWKFGDKSGGAQQRGAQVEYIFKKPGTFTVELVAYTTSGKSFDAKKTIVIRAPVLDACILPSRTSGSAPLGVSFKMTCSTGDPTSVEWDFGDGSQSDESSPIHVFEEPGIYQVKLTLEDELDTRSTDTVSITAE